MKDEWSFIYSSFLILANHSPGLSLPHPTGVYFCRTFCLAFPRIAHWLFRPSKPKSYPTPRKQKDSHANAPLVALRQK